MIFLAVGTQFPFDRLVKAIDDAIDRGLISEQVFAQIGDSTYRPRNFEFVASLPKHAFSTHIEAARAVIGHAGMGIITAAVGSQKPLLVMPRLRRYREVVSDHQVAIATRFAQMGHILVAHNANELPDRIVQLRSFIPKPRHAEPGIAIDRIRSFLDEISSQ